MLCFGVFESSFSLAAMEKRNFDLVIEIMKQGMKLTRARPAGKGSKKAKVLLSFHYFSLLVSHWLFSFIQLFTLPDDECHECLNGIQTGGENGGVMTNTAAIAHIVEFRTRRYL